MSKYEPLQLHLAQRGGIRVSMTFREIEQILGASLPSSAHDHAAWWSNERGPTSHVQCSAWQGAGYDVESVDRGAGSVTFVRV